jgi:hypothetical protein
MPMPMPMPEIQNSDHVAEDIGQPEDDDESMMEDPPEEQRKESNPPMSESGLMGSAIVQILLESASLFLAIYDLFA